jgi:hypothetical protein
MINCEAIVGLIGFAEPPQAAGHTPEEFDYYNRRPSTPNSVLRTPPGAGLHRASERANLIGFAGHTPNLTALITETCRIFVVCSVLCL